MSSKASKIFCAVFAAIITVFGILIFILPRPQFSEEENRTLASLPVLSFDSVLDGSFSKELSDFCNDRFPLRSSLLRLNALFSISLGRLESGGVMLGKDGNLIKRQELYDKKKLEINLSSVSRLREIAESHGAQSLLLCPPRTSDVLNDFSPISFASDTALWKMLEDENALCLNDTFRQKANAGEYIFYRTDHHWTSLGAYYAYCALGKSLGYEPYPLSYFTPQDVCTDFLGSTYSASHLRAVPDTVTAFRYKGDALVTVTDQGTSEVSGLFRDTALSTGSKYNYFLGGNKGHLKVESGEKPRLILVKDSFANSLVPFLAIHFNLDVIDPRYINLPAEKLVSDLYADGNSPFLLLVFNPETLYTDAGLKKFTR